MSQPGEPLRFLGFLAPFLLVACLPVSVHAAADLDAPRDGRRNATAAAAMLRELGLDESLWDPVRNRTPLAADDREPFYRLLAAVEKLDTADFIRRARESLGPNLSSVVPLFNEPDRQFGQLVLLEGTARRVVKIYGNPAHRSADARGDSAEDQRRGARQGVPYYYELDLITADSQNHPIVFCVRHLPPGFPEGENIAEPVRAVGFFFKVWAYGARGGAPGSGKQGSTRRQWELAPLVIGPGVQWLRPRMPQGSSHAGIIAGALIALVMAGIWLVLWNERRTARRFDQHRATLRECEHATGSFDAIEIQTQDSVPDHGSSPE